MIHRHLALPEGEPILFDQVVDFSGDCSLAPSRDRSAFNLASSLRLPTTGSKSFWPVRLDFWFLMIFCLTDFSCFLSCARCSRWAARRRRSSCLTGGYRRRGGRKYRFQQTTKKLKTTKRQSKKGAPSKPPASRTASLDVWYRLIFYILPNSFLVSEKRLKKFLKKTIKMANLQCSENRIQDLLLEN